MILFYLGYLAAIFVHYGLGKTLLVAAPGVFFWAVYETLVLINQRYEP